MASVNKRKWTHNGVEKEAWAVRYFDGKGKHRQKTFERKKDADAFLRKTEAEIAEGSHVASSEAMTVAALCELFLRSEQDRKADGIIGESRYRCIRACLDYCVVPMIGKQIAHQMKSSDVEDFYRAMRRERRLAASSAKGHLKILNQMFEFGIRRNLLAKNPVTAAQKLLRGVAAEAIRTFTPGEVRQLLASANVRRRKQHVRTLEVVRCIVHIAAFCGLRFGEIMALRVGNIDFQNRIIEVRLNLTAWDDLKEPKTKAGIRDVPMPPHVVQLLTDWISQHYSENERRLIFQCHTGSSISAGNFHKLSWRPLLKQAGLHEVGGRRFHFHALRHFAASWWIDHGLPLTDVASLMGHSKVDTTMQTYAHAMTGGQKRAEIFDGMAVNLLPAPDSVAHALRNAI